MLPFTFVVLAAGCAGSESASEPFRAGREVSPANGAKVFTQARCGDCHRLAAARSVGTKGPNLDDLRPSVERVARQVRSGGPEMPAFAGTLMANEIEAVAVFVARAAGTQGGKAIGFRPDETKLASCATSDCYQQAFGNIAFTEGPNVALARFDEAIRRDRQIEAECHPIAHTIGAAALLRHRGEVGKAFAEGGATCGSGYYHGLLEWKLANASRENVPAVARRACAEVRVSASRFVYYQCVHGLGHGLMLYTKYDLPGALRLCHRLATPFDQTSCTGGVFMENQNSSYGVRSTWLRDHDLIYPCTVVAERDKLYCYLLVTSQILPRVGWSWREAARWCRRVEEHWVATCFQSYGRDASGFTRQDPVPIARICRQAGEMENECVYGAARDILNNNSLDLGAKRLCESAATTIRSYCFFAIGTIHGAQRRTLAAKRKACERFARGRDLRECVRGATA